MYSFVMDNSFRFLRFHLIYGKCEAIIALLGIEGILLLDEHCHVIIFTEKTKSAISEL